MTLCNSVLSCIPLYCMSLFLIPSVVSLELDRLLRAFFGKVRKAVK